MNTIFITSKELSRDDLTLDEKLAIIDRSLKEAQARPRSKTEASAPIDPATALICNGCQ